VRAALSYAPDLMRRDVSCELCSAREPIRMFEKHGDTYVRCARCGLLYLDPQPSEAELAAVYGEHYYDAWGGPTAEANIASLKRRTFASLLARVAARTGVEQGRLLDLGCASGYLLEEAAARGFDPYGIEINEFAARKAREKLGADRIHCGTLEDSPYAASSFDAVVMSDLLEHVRSPSAVLRRTIQILRPGGLLIVVAPDAGGLSRRLLGRNWTDFKREHLYSFDRRTLAAMLGRASFQILEIRSFAKYLDLDYVDRQLSTFATPFFTPFVHLLHRVLPRRLARIPVPIVAGSMLALVRKPA
jgi:2-polyprenyl-3-methyl-5-hydroxy-6-metoxy-1,4-benzoquinol methylase